MAKSLTIILIIATLTIGSFGLKKDKFKIKAKGFGLSNLKAGHAAAAAPPAPYYPAPMPAAPMPYYPPAPPAPVAPAYPSGGYGGGGGGFNGAAGFNSAASASFSAGSAPVAPHVVPVIIPIALMTQPQVSSGPIVSQSPLSSLSSNGFGLSSQLGGAQTYIPRVDLEYVMHPVSDMGSPTYGFSAIKGNSFDSFNTADQFDTFDSFGLSSAGSYSG